MAANRENGYASVRLSWWRNSSDRRFWMVTVLGVEASEFLMGRTVLYHCVTDDFGNLVRVS